MRSPAFLALLLAGCGAPFFVPRADVELVEVPAEGLREDFDGALDHVRALSPEAHTPPRFESGALVLDTVGNGGWYSDASGTLLAVLARGSFLAETRVTATSLKAPGTRPRGDFTSAGLLVRDPLSRELEQRWVMYNIGQQDNFYGFETKTTRPFDGAFHVHNLAGYRSLSTLYLTPFPGDGITAELRLCRVGGQLRFYARLPGEADWKEQEITERTERWGNGDKEPTPGVTGRLLRMDRPDLPDAVQVGLILNAGSDLEARGVWDHFEVRAITSFEECERASR